MNCGSIRQPLLESRERMEMHLQYRVRELHMNSDEMSWLLQTMGDPETAKRFVQAQYDCGRIRYQVLADLAREHGWTDYPPIQVFTPPSSIEYATAWPAIWAVAEQFHEGAAFGAR